MKCDCQVKGTKGYDNLLKTEKFLKAINHKHRLMILCFLKDEMHTVGEIQERLKLPQNMTSHNIAILKKLDLLKEKKEGQFRKYTVNQRVFKNYLQHFCEIIGIH